MRLGRRSLLVAPAVVAAPAPVPAAEAWPSRPVRIIVPFTPGGSNDALARPLAERLTARFGQSFLVENRPGAGSAVGVQAAAQSPPDGHTLLLTTSSVAAIGPVQGSGFDPSQALDAVAFLAKSPMAILTPPASPLASIQALVAADRAKPHSVTYASSGPGSTVHIITELFNLRAGTTLQHVPYRGTAPALTDLIAGRVDVMFSTVISAQGQLQGGLLRVIAYTGADRPPGTPPAPTVRDAGIDYESGIWWGVFAPRGIPPTVLARLNAAINATIAEPGFAATMAREGTLPQPMEAPDFAGFLRREVAAMREVVAAAKIRAD
jgi:tripartite-type tricarboxylate transporter receptor subunit TctC